MRKQRDRVSSTIIRLNGTYNVQNIFIPLYPRTVCELTSTYHFLRSISTRPNHALTKHFKVSHSPSAQPPPNILKQGHKEKVYHRKEPTSLALTRKTKEQELFAAQKDKDPIGRSKRDRKLGVLVLTREVDPLIFGVHSRFDIGKRFCVIPPTNPLPQSLTQTIPTKPPL